MIATTTHGRVTQSQKNGTCEPDDRPSVSADRDDTRDGERIVLAGLLDEQPGLAAQVMPEYFMHDIERDAARNLTGQLRGGSINTKAFIESLLDDGHDGAAIDELCLAVNAWLPQSTPSMVAHELRKLRGQYQKLRLSDGIVALQRKLESGRLDPGEAAAAMRELAEAEVGDDGSGDESLADIPLDPADDDGEAIALRTGLPWWDDALPEGGVQVGSIIGISAPPGGGKSALAGQLTARMLLQYADESALWLMGEMSKRQLRNRLLAMFARLNPKCFRNGVILNDDQQQRRQAAIDLYGSICDRIKIARPPLTPAMFENRIIATGARWAVIDYLQLMQPNTEETTRREAIDGVMRELVRITRQHNVGLLLLSNMAKPAHGGVPSIYEAFKESSQIPHDLDAAYTVQVCDGQDDLPKTAPLRQWWKCLKQRDGEPRDIAVTFDRATMTFVGGHGRV